MGDGLPVHPIRRFPVADQARAMTCNLAAGFHILRDTFPSQTLKCIGHQIVAALIGDMARSPMTDTRRPDDCLPSLSGYPPFPAPY